jgi:myo-inositol-1(or 4)-monophosphatase
LLDLRGRVAVREKAPRDLVTEADLASQCAIHELIRGCFPAHGFVGEETPSSALSSCGSSNAAEYRWIVDPLDGTVNYVHGLQAYCVSVALEHAGAPIVGVVYDPVRDECFSASAGGGVCLNGDRVRVSACRRLCEALVGASFSANVQRDSEEITRFVEVLAASQSVRRLGSAALTMSYVAAGRLDAYWATGAKSWDVAAGVLLVREAGGVLTSVDGSPFQLRHPLLAASSTPELHAELLGALAGAGQTKARP